MNDLYATSNDPLAWEFRHPLFRQGEPHLLASIKRKTTRPPTEGISPSDEMSDRAVAGWMRDDPYGPGSSPTLNALPPQSSGRLRPEVFGFNLKTGETIQARPYEMTARPASKAFVADLLRPATEPGSEPRKYHPRPPPSQARSVPAPNTITDTGQYPQPIPPVAALTSQVAFLEERVAKLSETLSLERVESVRTHMDLLSYVMSITEWLPSEFFPLTAVSRELIFQIHLQRTY